MTIKKYRPHLYLPRQLKHQNNCLDSKKNGDIFKKDLHQSIIDRNNLRAIYDVNYAYVTELFIIKNDSHFISKSIFTFIYQAQKYNKPSNYSLHKNHSSENCI